MSDRVRIAVVAEGPTDVVVLEAALRAILAGRRFVLTQLQPETSLAFDFGERGAGWVGVYRWCKQAGLRGGGRLAQDDLLFANHDLLVIHLDADVASKAYSDGSILPDPGDKALPCALPCPPARNTTDALRKVLLSWCGETVEPGRIVLCVPSKSTEAWVVASLFPGDAAPRAAIPFECHPNPEVRLGQQPKAQRIRKSVRDYRVRSPEMEKAWGRIAAPGALGEALRFEAETRAALDGSP